MTRLFPLFVVLGGAVAVGAIAMVAVPPAPPKGGGRSPLPPAPRCTMKRIEALVVHTTAGSRGADIEAVRRYHVEHRGWSDVGYHYLVRDNGQVQAGRPETVCGAHALGWNDRSLGVAFAGNHDRYPWSPAAEQSGIDLLARLCLKHGLSASAVIGHRETGAKKSCPGAHVDMDAVRRLVATRMSLLRSA